MHLRITDILGKEVDCIPVNAALCLEDAAYGLIEKVGSENASVLIAEIVNAIRDQCEPVSIDDFDAKAGMKAGACVYYGELVNDCI